MLQKSQLIACFSFVILISFFWEFYFFHPLHSSHFVPAGWAPYAYFQVLAERNDPQPPASRISSLRLRQPEIETVYMQSGNDSRSASPILDAMENGGRF